MSRAKLYSFAVRSEDMNPEVPALLLLDWTCKFVPSRFKDTSKSMIQILRGSMLLIIMFYGFKSLWRILREWRTSMPSRIWARICLTSAFEKGFLYCFLTLIAFYRSPIHSSVTKNIDLSKKNASYRFKVWGKLRVYVSIFTSLSQSCSGRRFSLYSSVVHLLRFIKSVWPSDHL